MLILTTKLKNAINKKKPGMEFSLHQISVNGNKRGTSGWIRNPENNSVVYVNTEGIKKFSPVTGLIALLAKVRILFLFIENVIPVSQVNLFHVFLYPKESSRP